jgi:hypothetical protein
MSNKTQVMSYDLMNRRDNVTNHHSSVVDSIQTIENYLAIGAPPQKINRLSNQSKIARFKLTIL